MRTVGTLNAPPRSTQHFADELVKFVFVKLRHDASPLPNDESPRAVRTVAGGLTQN
jgi:hypothetical protein